MGIERHNGHANYFARCDGCDKRRELRASHHYSAGKELRAMGWKRVDYVETIRVYLWNCAACAKPECNSVVKAE